MTFSFFSHFPKFCTFSYQFSNFTKIRSLGAVLHLAPVTKFFLVIYLHFFTKTGPLNAPQGGYPGPSHHSHPLRHVAVGIRTNIEFIQSSSPVSHKAVHIRCILSSVVSPAYLNNFIIPHLVLRSFHLPLL